MQPQNVPRHPDGRRRDSGRRLGRGSAMASTPASSRLGNGRALFGTELGWESYRPDDTTLAGISVPVEVIAGRDSAPLIRGGGLARGTAGHGGAGSAPEATYRC